MYISIYWSSCIQESYWRRAAAWLSVQRLRGRAALMGTFMRQAPGDVPNKKGGRDQEIVTNPDE